MNSILHTKSIESQITSKKNSKSSGRKSGSKDRKKKSGGKKQSKKNKDDEVLQKALVKQYSKILKFHDLIDPLLVE